MRARGFTLIEVLIVVAVSVLLAALAWPTYRGQLLRAGRSEAIEALQRIQLAQERHRARFGVYTTELQALGFAATTGGGRYKLELDALGIEAYRVSARALGAGAQRGDSACPTLSFEVRQGFATLGPEGRCWNR